MESRPDWRSQDVAIRLAIEAATVALGRIITERRGCPYAWWSYWRIMYEWAAEDDEEASTRWTRWRMWWALRRMTVWWSRVLRQKTPEQRLCLQHAIETFGVDQLGRVLPPLRGKFRPPLTGR